MRTDHRAVIDELSRWGVKPIMEQTRGGHIRFRWHVKDDEYQIVTGKTNSDHRAGKNNIAEIRRQMRKAGLTEPPSCLPVKAETPTPEGPRPPTIEERLARLERVCEAVNSNVEMLLDIMTNPETKFLENLVPMKLTKLLNGHGNGHSVEPTKEKQPKPTKEKPPKQPRQNAGANCWLWRAMRYDEFMTAEAIAKVAGRTIGAASVMLSIWKKRGYVEHVGKGWRKHRSVEELCRTQH